MIAFTLPGGLPVYGFSLLAGLGACLGLGWAAWLEAAQGRSALHPVDAGLWALLGGLAGGRAAFVSLNWPYFQQQSAQIWNVGQGGLAWPGALAGSLIAVAMVSWFARRPFGAVADALLPLATTITIAGWLGCWLEGCAYGPSTNSWWGLPGRDEWGTLSQRWPTQLIGALLTLVTFWLVERLPAESTPAGWKSGLGILALSLQLFLLTFLRADPAPLWRGLRADAWPALIFILLALVTLAGIKWSKRT